ncbi:MAG: hypothetical protein U5K27_09800 [Desulfotignum sp.]|nr:hypothetical protein [Desulfotignum sp.]
MTCRFERTIQHIVGWLDSYVEKSGLTGFCVGVSGGIDSAVTSTLCARTNRPTMVLNMPIFQASDQLSRASAHNAWLQSFYKNVTPVDLDLTPAFSSIQKNFPSRYPGRIDHGQYPGPSQDAYALCFCFSPPASGDRHR